MRGLTPAYDLIKEAYYRAPIKSTLEARYRGRALKALDLGGALAFEDLNSIASKLVALNPRSEITQVDCETVNVKRMLRSVTRVKIEKTEKLTIYRGRLKGSPLTGVTIVKGSLNDFLSFTREKYDVLNFDFYDSFNLEVEQSVTLTLARRLMRLGATITVNVSEPKQCKTRPALRRIYRLSESGKNYARGGTVLLRKLFKKHGHDVAFQYPSPYRNIDRSTNAMQMHFWNIQVN